MLIANDLAKLKELHDNRVLTLQTNRGCSATAGTEHTVSSLIDMAQRSISQEAEIAELRSALSSYERISKARRRPRKANNKL